nr:MAG TPA: hypothetical protein [Caudoviricetes sp.]
MVISCSKVLCLKGRTMKKWLFNFLERIRSPILYLVTVSQAQAGDDENTMGIKVFQLAMPKRSLKRLTQAYELSPLQQPFIVLDLDDKSKISINVNAVREISAIPCKDEDELKEFVKSSEFTYNKIWIGMREVIIDG